MSMMLKTGLKLFETLSEGKPHSSITDWVDILTGDNYALDELDGVAELVEAVDIQGATGPDEASRAIRKKLKYGSVHRQIRALTLLKALSENSRTFPKSFASSPQLLDRLRETARDYHTDPDVKRRLMGVLKGWKVQHDEGDRAFSRVAGMWAELGGSGAKRASTLPVGSGGGGAASASKPPTTRDEGLWDHSWDVSPAAAAASRQSSKAEEAQRQLDASARRAEAERAKLVNDAKERERREMERRERELADREERVKREERMLAARKKNGGSSVAAGSGGAKAKAMPKRPPFNFEKEKPAILSSVAGASQAANNLINAIRLVNRETESITTNARVQKYLEEAKTLRKRVIRYIQLVEDEEYIGTLLSTNETIITALQLYDKMAKPATHDSDDEAPTTAQTVNPNEAKTEEEALGLKMAAQRLQDERASELAKLQAKQRHAVARDRLRRGNSAVGSIGGGGGDNSSSGATAHPDLQDLDFGGSRGPPTSDGRYGAGAGADTDAYGRGTNDSLSDLSDYDSSDDDYRLRSAAQSRRQSVDQSSAYSAGNQDAPYGNLLDTPAADDPFADPFFREGPETPMAKERKEWTSV